MERFTVAASMNGCHKPTSFHTITSPISFPVKPHNKQSQQPRHDQNPVPINDAELSIFSAERYFNDNNHDQKENHHTPTKRVVSFDKVEERCDFSLFRRDSSVSSGDGYGRNYKQEPSRITPTSSSEASWNSQSGLLANPPGSAAVTFRAFPSGKQRRGLQSSSSSSSSSSWWIFGQSCPCSGKRSVDVEEKFSEPKGPYHSNFDSSADGYSMNLKKQSVIYTVAPSVVKSVQNMKAIYAGGECEEKRETFQIPSLYNSPDSTHRHSTGVGHRIFTSGVPFTDSCGFSFPVLTKQTQDNHEPPRDSLEVFRPRDENTPLSKPFEFQQWKTTPENVRRSSFAFPASPKPRILDDDVASDSSSDLFEIESFPTQMTSGPSYRRRDSLDEILAMDPRRFIENAAGILQLRHGVEEPARPSNAPSECYPPSEVSVQWSVTTAEGFDRCGAANFSSAASEYEEMAFVAPEKKRGNGGLLSCRCEKAVSVGPHPVRCVTEQKRVEVGSSAVALPLRVESGSRGSERPPLARSHSARLTRPIQTR